MRLGAIGRSGRTHLLHPTQAGLLLFGREQEIVRELPFYSLHFSEAPGTHQDLPTTIASDDGTWSGNVFDFWLHVSARLADWAEAVSPWHRSGEPTPDPITSVQAAPPTGQPAALVWAAREVVANALAHADYRGRGGIGIVCDAAGICAESPGRLPAEEDATQQGGLIAPRNPALKSMLELAGLGRPRGGGIAALQEECRHQAGVRLDLSESCDPERTTLALTLCVPDTSSLAACSLRLSPDRGDALPEVGAA